MFTTRKVLAGAVSGIMCLSMLAAGVAAAGETEIPNASDITVDGKLEEAYWGATTWNELTNPKDAAPSNNEASFAAAWDDDNLYIAIKVVDDVVVTDSNGLSTTVYCQDGVEIFIDPTNEKGAFTDATLHWFYSVSTETNDAMGKAWANVLADHPDVKVAHSMTDDGYIVEAMFPWADVMVEGPAVGDVIGLEVAINDDDDAGSWADSDRTELYWSPAIGAGSSETWGTATLGKEIKIPEPVVDTPADPTPSEPSSSANTFDLTAVALAASALSAAAFAVSKKKSR